MTTQEKQALLKKEITLGELIGMTIIVLGICFGFYTSTNQTLENHEIRIENVEKAGTEQKAELQRRFDQLNEKMDELIKGQNEIRVKLEGKEDKH